MDHCKRKLKGFSLVEMIAASVILSSGVVAICALNTGSFTSVRANRQREVAWAMLDRQFTIIDYMGLDEFMNLRQFSGQIGPTEEDPMVYYWSADFEEGLSDNLYTITITIAWGPENRMQSISASTVLNGTDNMFIEEETEEETEAA